MKIRNGFVSNSSSSSFIIRLDNLTGKQLYQIINHIDEAKEIGFNTYNDLWYVNVDTINNIVVCETSMDNFDMYGFVEAIGVDRAKIEKRYHSNDIYDNNEDYEN